MRLPCCLTCQWHALCWQVSRAQASVACDCCGAVRNRVRAWCVGAGASASVRPRVRSASHVEVEALTCQQHGALLAGQQQGRRLCCVHPRPRWPYTCASQPLIALNTVAARRPVVVPIARLQPSLLLTCQQLEVVGDVDQQRENRAQGQSAQACRIRTRADLRGHLLAAVPSRLLASSMSSSDLSGERLHTSCVSRSRRARVVSRAWRLISGTPRCRWPARARLSHGRWGFPRPGRGPRRSR